jgi:hypothetical protein
MASNKLHVFEQMPNNDGRSFVERAVPATLVRSMFSVRVNVTIAGRSSLNLYATTTAAFSKDDFAGSWSSAVARAKGANQIEDSQR